MGLLPHKKVLVERLKDQPFTFLGMFGREGDPKEIAARMKKENINWRNALDLGEAEDGPLWSTWAVRGFPQFYLLDEQGVIRQRWFGNPGEDVIDRAVEALLAELAAKSAKK
ncbi:MAG: TlpA family protein disulfide reductase [Planctomycetes bacterium]|nr:TlpA family protein disulfide reductase [Planctomycetota bacterium]